MFRYLAVLACFLFASVAYAADGGYSLFNPVPDDKMRAFATDRPTKSYSPITVDAGHFQYEADWLSWTYSRRDTTTSNFLVMDPTFKVGLTAKTDLELVLAPLNYNNTHDRVAGTHNTAAGFGDVTARLKYNIIGDDGGDYALAVTPYVKAPTAAHNVGNNHWEGGFYVPFSVALPDDFTLALMTEADVQENAALNGYHMNYQNLVNVSHSVFTDALTGSVEFWSDANNDQGASDQYTADVALAWSLSPNVQLDSGVNFGLSRAASDFQPYIGISQRF